MFEKLFCPPYHQQHFESSPSTLSLTPLSFIMDAVSRNLDRESMEPDDREEAVADLKTQLGDMQISGGGDALIDDYDMVDEKQDVAIITPEDSIEDFDPLADDCRFFRL